jgi:hypothetical protein
VEHFNQLTIWDSFMVLLSNVDFNRILFRQFMMITKTAYYWPCVYFLYCITVVCRIKILTMSSFVTFNEYALSASHLSIWCGTNSNHIDNYGKTQSHTPHAILGWNQDVRNVLNSTNHDRAFVLSAILCWP